MDEKYAFYLSGFENITNRKKEEMFQAFGSAMSIYNAGEKKLSIFLNSAQIDSFLAGKNAGWEKKYENMMNQNIRFIPFYDKEYPYRLRHIEDKPFGIFVKGRLPREHKKSVAIIGARDCSEYGRFVAEDFGSKLAAAGISVISGMARGVDGIAMRGALKAGGEAFGVLGCGVDVCYPGSNRSLYEETQTRGGIISEYIPGTAPLALHFPKRNRIISGLADMVLVVEARVKSGTLITVDMALEQGKDVYVIPGRITDSLSEGCNGLILQGCGVALDPEQLLADLGMDPNNSGNQQNAKEGNYKQLSLEQFEMLSLLSLDLQALPQIMDKLKDNTYLKNFTLPQTMETLMELVIAGFVKNEGSYFGLLQPFSH